MVHDDPRKSNEANFMALLNFIADPAVILDEKGRFLVINDAFVDLIGLRSKKKLIGMMFLDLDVVDTENKEKVLKNFRKRMQGLHVDPYEINFTDKTGKDRCVELKAKKINYSGQQADLVILRDITRRKENARRLKEYSEKMEALVNEKIREIKENKEKLETIFNSSPDAITLLDLKGNIIECNEATAHLHGFLSRDELIGRSAFELISLKKRREASKLMSSILKKGSMKNVEFSLVAKEGKEFTAEASVSVISNAAGKPIGFVTITKDITERKKMGEALQESEEKYRSMIEQAPDLIVTIDEKGIVTSCNAALERGTDYSQHEIIGKHFLETPLLHGIDPAIAQKLFNAIIEEKHLEPIELKWFLKDGTPRISEVRIGLMKKDGKRAGFTAVARDITDRKKAEAKLLTSEKKYRRLFEELKIAEKQLLEERDRAQNYLDIADVILVALDTKGRITMLNRKGCEILECSVGEALGKNWFDNFIPKKIKANVLKYFKLLLAGKACLQEYNENPILAKNGEIRLIGWRNTVLKDNNGRIIGTLSSGENITEWKMAQQALTDSEEKFRAISTYASDAIILLDKTDKIVYWNLAAEKIFGYTKEEAIGKKLNALVVPPKSHKRHLEMLERLFNKQMQISEKRTEITALAKKRTEFPIELSATVLNLTGARYVLEIIRDISERKKMEDNLKQERDMLEAVTENIGAGLAIISKDYRIIWANKLLKQINGNCEDKICYSAFNRLTEVCPDCGVQKVFDKGVPIETHEHSTKDAKGNPVRIQFIVTPIKDEEGKIVSALELAVDITERKRMEDKLAEYSQQLEKLVDKRTEQLKQMQAKLVTSERLATIGELAAMVGHDLRNPLTGIMGATYYLKTKHGAELGAKGKEMLETIEKSINHSNKIVNDLLEYSRKLKLDLTKTTPKALLKSTLPFLEIPREIQIVDATEGKPKVRVDTEKMVRVFVNIIQNAIDAMPDGGTLKIKSRELKSRLIITFKDSGMGMSKETLHNLWTPLFTTKAKGMGFGLPICKRIAEAHGGKLSVKSKIGKGTTVTVTIPENPKSVNAGEEKMIFNESMLSTITATQETA